jgi:hypothetical protein
MKMDGNIRVATDVKYKELYNNMKSNGAMDDFHELFFLCACIGYKKAKNAPIKKRDDRFLSNTITPLEWACYYAMVLEKNDFNYEKLSADKAVLITMEGYANAGMEILIKDFLGDYLLPSNKSTDPQLNPTDCKELPKNFVHYIFEESESENRDN